jgi:anthranilate synthase component I
MLIPDFNQFEELCRSGNLVPVMMEIPGDLDTPLSAFMKIEDPRGSFLLESVEGGKQWARYSFLGADPRIVVRSRDGAVEIVEGDSVRTFPGISDPTPVLKMIMSRFSPAVLPGFPQFFGGAVGFLGYDIAREFERIPNLGKPDPGFNNAWFMFTKDIVVFDNVSHKILLITTVSPEEFSSSHLAYQDGLFRLENLNRKLSKPVPSCSGNGTSNPIQIKGNISPESFHEMVRRGKSHIKAGDIIQVVLSQRFEAEGIRCPFNVYRGLRMINPSPYMFFLRMGDESFAGSSPEVMVRLRDGEALVRPIAGTRPRGQTAAEDEQMEQELISDEKESAEHVMLVDLARNDLGRIAAPGTVTVDSFKKVEKYSHVMHMVSTVRARPAKGFDAFDVLRATFPAGTLSGAPKIRAMEIIEDLEPEHRGPYGGCVGYFSFNGAMDMGITIRTVVMKGARTYFQAGAGIVADSEPEKEYMETIEKAKAMEKALTIAQRFERSSK